MSKVLDVWCVLLKAWARDKYEAVNDVGENVGCKR